MTLLLLGRSTGRLLLVFSNVRLQLGWTKVQPPGWLKSTRPGWPTGRLTGSPIDLRAVLPVTCMVLLPMPGMELLPVTVTGTELAGATELAGCTEPKWPGPLARASQHGSAA